MPEISRTGKEGSYICGLIGGTGKVEARYMVALGCLAEDRGADSAGVAWQVGDKLRISKVAKNPLVAYPVDLAPALRHAAKYGAPIVGHTRQATQGIVNARNAHPFLDEKNCIAWAHNGMISNDNEFGKFEVDSECLIGGILSKDFSKFRGSIALLWIEDGKLHAFRHNNPLWRGVKRGAVYLASTEDMLKEIGCHKMKELSEDFIYVWKGNQLESTKKVPVHTWTKFDAQAWRGHYDTYNEDRELDLHRYSIGGVWHNHSSHVGYDYSCRGCQATESANSADLVPVTQAGSLAESYIEKMERDEAEGDRNLSIIDEQDLCAGCGKRERLKPEWYCAVCDEKWITYGYREGLDHA